MTRKLLPILILMILPLRAEATDTRLQRAAESALGGRRGAVVVISLPERRVLALAGGKTAREAFPPGSIFKLATAHIALTEGVTGASEKIECRNAYLAGRVKLICTKAGGHGDIDIKQAIASSCNLHFYSLARRLGAERLERGAIKLGWLDRPLSKHLVTPAQVALFGVGEAPGLRVTPIHAAELVGDIALGSGRANEIVREGMVLAVKKGTATAAAVPGMSVAGKTGTPVDPKVAGGTHAWFVGFAPAGKPRIAIAVFVSRGHGYDTAAPIAGKVLGAYFGGRHAGGPTFVSAASPAGMPGLLRTMPSRQGSASMRQSATIRVGLFRREKLTSVELRCPSKAVLSDGPKTTSLPSISRCRISLDGDGIGMNGRHFHSLLVRTSEFVLTAPGREPRPYRGALIVRPARGALLIINEVSLEDYARSVLPGEMPPEWPREALACQAVITRTFAMAARNRHGSDGFDLCDLTHCQVYRGRMDERPATDEAVRMTRGIVLRRGGKLLDALYHSTCGGKTASAKELWPNRPTSLGSVSDVESSRSFCRESPHFRWSVVLSADQIGGALSMQAVRDVRVLEKGPSGHVTRVRVAGRQSRGFTGEAFWMAVCRRVGWGKIKSTCFEVKAVPSGFRFTGKGLGHGVGLCQWGARGMAQAGYDFRAILRHYYPGADYSLPY